MAYYLVKADETRNIHVGDEYARTLTATLNKFFVMDYLIPGMTNYYVDLPDDIWEDFTFSEFTDGKKVKAGWDPFKGRVELLNRGLPANHIRYTPEQVERRIEVRKFLGKVFIDDALRMGKIDSVEHQALLTEMAGIDNDVALNLFYMKLHFDD